MVRLGTSLLQCTIDGDRALSGYGRLPSKNRRIEAHGRTFLALRILGRTACESRLRLELLDGRSELGGPARGVQPRGRFRARLRRHHANAWTGAFTLADRRRATTTLREDSVALGRCVHLL